MDAIQNMTQSITTLQNIIHYAFKTPVLLEKALAHPSAMPRNKDFERFEFLGDRVLGLCVANLLLKAFPEEPEGHLAKRQAYLVSKEVCQIVAKQIQLEDYIHVIYDKGAHASNMMAILADAVEALLGAMYLDGGLAACEGFVQRHWSDVSHREKTPPKDAKSALQEWAQKRGKSVPVYTLVNADGPSHQPMLIYSVAVDGLPIFKGEGGNRRTAEQIAAKAALSYIEIS